MRRFMTSIRSIRVKLAAVIMLLLGLMTAASSVIVMRIMDRVLLEELTQKGFSIGRSAATAAAYNFLSGDVLALDNLASKLKDLHPDVHFVAAVDNDGKIVAHSRLGEAGKWFFTISGETVNAGSDGAVVVRNMRAGDQSYEFQVPIVFAEKKLGDIYLAVDADVLVGAQAEARRKILVVAAAVMTLGALGTFLLSAFITTPIKRLREGVAQLSEGRHDEALPVVSRDELGELTKSFNEMASTILAQRDTLEHNARELEQAYMAMVRVLATAIDARDQYTLGHSNRVARLSLLMGRKLGLSEEELTDLEIACMFHDVGKMRTPDHILHKREPLNEEEYLQMMKHTIDGAEILRLAESLHRYIPAALHHHEWYDGSGYPEGLKGSEIPLSAAIVAITDAYDAMTTSRPYRAAMTREDAMAELDRERGTQFDPRLLDVFLEVLAEYDGNEQAWHFLKG
jgi:putative nucleotidyltransferase with HDIG domain